MPPFSKHFYDFLLNLFGKLGYCHSVELAVTILTGVARKQFWFDKCFCVTDLEFRIINGMRKKKRLTSQLEIYSKERKKQSNVISESQC